MQSPQTHYTNRVTHISRVRSSYTISSPRPATGSQAEIAHQRQHLWLRIAAVFCAAVVLQILVMSYTISIYDESLGLYGALRVFHGQVPYRDFWTMYPPGEFYLLAAVFRLFGVMALWGRVVFILANAISTVLIVDILIRLTRKPWLSFLSAFAILLWLNARASYTFPIYPALTFILFATACMLRRWRDDQVCFVFWAGAALGLAALFRHDLALYAVMALGGASMADQLLRERSWRNRSSWADLIRLSITSVLVVAPLVVLLLVSVPVHDLYYCLFYVPGHIYPKVRSLPFPNLRQIVHGFLHPYNVLGPVQGDTEYNIVWLPLLVVAAGLPAILFRIRYGGTGRWRLVGLTALVLLTGLLFLKGFVRVSPLHMAPAIVPALMLLTCLVAEIPVERRAFRSAVLFVTAWASLCLFAATHRDYVIFRYNWRVLRGTEPGGASFESACHPPAGLERARCLFLPNSEEPAILFLQSKTGPRDKIFVGVPRYDVLHLSDIEIYFLSKREAATGWYDLHPGVQTTEPIQREMIRSLESAHVSYIVRDNLQYPDEPNQSRFSSGVNLLGNYISRNYETQRTFGALEVLKRVTPFIGSVQAGPSH